MNDDSRRLYLNTHKIVAVPQDKYSGTIFYAYCYPGVAKKMFFGYAKYIIDSNTFTVHLQTKVEFSDGWFESTYNQFNDCSRIISMDCKNNQLWISWMSGDNKKYLCWHCDIRNLIQ